MSSHHFNFFFLNYKEINANELSQNNNSVEMITHLSYSRSSDKMSGFVCCFVFKIVFPIHERLCWMEIGSVWRMNRWQDQNWLEPFCQILFLVNDFEDGIAPSPIAAIELRRFFINFLFGYKNMKNDLLNVHKSHAHWSLRHNTI